MRRAFANKVDATSTALIEEARKYGATYVPVNGTFDGVLFYQSRLWVIDWKSKGTKLTKRQSALLADGFPIFFIRTSDELRALLFGGPSA